ncbi:hypothetical protein [Pleurocapsa sp. PCC 7319]|uniref:hypothetical protein n=1 Tax=Pleurocapsa sp. PCC 7319 TaxID=118161 RepID=UPI000347961E|nr:hypothetical protein [Pleurocapsa sp. PCC 7319]
MTSPKPLHGIELLDCAQANAKLGLSTTTQQCGYGNNILAFQNELQKAGSKIGIHINSLNDLILETKGIERERDFSPDSSGRI